MHFHHGLEQIKENYDEKTMEGDLDIYTYIKELMMNIFGIKNKRKDTNTDGRSR